MQAFLHGAEATDNTGLYLAIGVVAVAAVVAVLLWRRRTHGGA